MNTEKFNRDFYMRDAVTVARELLGKTLVHCSHDGTTKGRIVECEAYMGSSDPASHSHDNLQTSRTEVMYGDGGYVYTYIVYGIHVCMNVVANVENVPEAVLIRALDPLEGIELMKKRRGKERISDLCSGPGKLCSAMGIDMKNYGTDLCDNEIFVEHDEKFDHPVDIVSAKRIGVDSSKDLGNYRFYIEGNRFVSKI